MYVKPVLLLTSKKLRDQISFRLSTLFTFIQPILWICIFLFLREGDISVDFKGNTIRYIDFLIIGIFVWRTVSFVLGRLPKEIQLEGPALRSIVTSSSGVQVLLWSSIISTSLMAILIGITIIVTGVIIYDLSLFINEIILVALVYFLVLMIHFGLAMIFVSSYTRFRDLRNAEFITTTILGLLSGVFLPVNLFPYPLSEIAYVLPLTQGLILIRELTLLHSGMLHLNLLFLLVAESIIFFSSGLILYGKTIRYQAYSRH